MLPRGAVFLGIAVLRKAVTLSAQQLERIAGDYDLDGEVWTIAPRDGRLFARNRDLPELEILTESANSLFLPDGGGDLTVIEDRRGGVAGLVLRQDDRGERKVRRIR
jgi:hypothetical protein